MEIKVGFARSSMLASSSTRQPNGCYGLTQWMKTVQIAWTNPIQMRRTIVNTIGEK